jgi:glutamine amidotransferase
MNAAIIDYGMGNVASVEKALSFLGVSSTVTNDFSKIQSSDCIVLPGVGAFNQGMNNLKRLGLVKVLNSEIIDKKKPFLGICLGMQLLATTGSEPELCSGLGWIDGEVLKINDENLPLPHLGWNNLLVKKESFISEFDQKDFYFIHSYHFKVLNPLNVIATVDYGGSYVAAVKKDNIFATQFHPEKSQTAGLELLKLFFSQNA